MEKTDIRDKFQETIELDRKLKGLHYSGTEWMEGIPYHSTITMDREWLGLNRSFTPEKGLPKKGEE